MTTSWEFDILFLMTKKGLSPDYKFRNDALLNDYRSGKYQIVDLVSKYRISSARIYKIISLMEKAEHDAEMEGIIRDEQSS